MTGAAAFCQVFKCAFSDPGLAWCKARTAWLADVPASRAVPLQGRCRCKAGAAARPVPLQGRCRCKAGAAARLVPLQGRCRCKAGAAARPVLIFEGAPHLSAPNTLFPADREGPAPDLPWAPPHGCQRPGGAPPHPGCLCAAQPRRRLLPGALWPAALARLSASLQSAF